MKKILALPILVLFAACNTQPNYTKMVERTYNFNKYAANIVMSSDTTSGSFIEADNNGGTMIYDNNSDFILNASITSLEVATSKTTGNKLVARNGFEITQEKIGDTLILKYFPTDKTPTNVLKFGTEYKFYK